MHKDRPVRCDALRETKFFMRVWRRLPKSVEFDSHSHQWSVHTDQNTDQNNDGNTAVQALEEGNMWMDEKVGRVVVARM